ncbi:MAG: carbohydrate-binding protein [Algibacter sp.]
MKKNVDKKKRANIFLKKKVTCFMFFLLVSLGTVSAQFVHPGITSTKSDLDRLKYMVESQLDPWYTSYQDLSADSRTDYNYSVQGNSSNTVLGRDANINLSAWRNDVRAAYGNAIRWYVSGDSRHADKAVEIFNAWKNLQDVTSAGTSSLSGSISYIMIEAAEIIKSTYSGWSANDIQDFKDMLVYPGYSNIAEPAGISTTSGSFYWQAYQGDPVRHGNQGLAGFRALAAMAVFLDNEIMYDRVLRNVRGQPHRSDDIPYPAGPNTSTTISSSAEFSDTYNIIREYYIEDYGYDEVITNYIYANGQCQESARDQSHALFGISNITSIAEIAWNQGDDLYSHENDRLLLGLEYTAKYGVSSLQSYPDQTSPWVPTVASGEFIEGFDRTGRFYSKAISSIHAGGFPGELPVFEMPIGHYQGRGFKTDEEIKWIGRARDLAIESTGFEDGGHIITALGWGALTERRVDGGCGDPISGFDSNGLPEYSMHVLPGTLEAENFDYSPVSGEGRTYHEITPSNSGGSYRADEAIDIESLTGGGYNLTSIENGEWLTYTVYVPSDGTYDIDINYASANAGGTIKFNFKGVDITSDVAVPFGAPNSIALTDWKNFEVASTVRLSKGVQALKILFNGTDDAFKLNNFTVSLIEADPDPINLATTYGVTTQSSTAYSGPPELAIDGNTNGNYGDGSVTHTDHDDNPKWWQVDLQANYNIETITIFNRTGSNYGERLIDFTVEVLDSNGAITFTQFYAVYPNPSLTITTGGVSGSVVRISKTSDLGLSLAEVEIYGVDKILSDKTFEKIDNVQIYPNPVKNIFSLTNSQGSVVEVYNIIGKLMMKTKIDLKNQSFNVTTFSTGVYFVRINNAGVINVKKIIKE